MRRWLFFLGCILSAVSASAQCTISGKTRVCLGDMATYEISGTVSSTKWNFGDGYTSNDIKAKHLYKKAGSYTVTCDVKLSSGASCQASLPIEVVGLPVPVFSRFGSNDSCQFVNEICFKDNSTPASSGQTIVKRLVVWGDGTYDLSTNPAGAPDVCHTFNSADVFRVKFEVTDIYGCKNSTVGKVRIIAGPRAALTHEVTYPVCGIARVCFKNVSDTPAAGNIYYWFADGKNFARMFKTTECYDVVKSQTMIARLTVNTRGGCQTEVQDTVTVNLESLQTGLSGYKQICYGAGFGPKFWLTGDKDVKVKWYFDGKPMTNFAGDTLRFRPKDSMLTLGKHNVSVDIEKLSCVQRHSMDFIIAGPVAQFRMANRIQCDMQKKVFMWDITDLKNRKKASWHWEIKDPYGMNCVTWRAQGQNLNTNCNEALDWYHKHQFTTNQGIHTVHLYVHDSITGCADTAGRRVLRVCPKFGTGTPIVICQGRRFLEYDDLSDPEAEPVSFSLDTGRTFMPYHSKVFAPYEGLYGVYLVWRKARPDSAADFGNDSLLTFHDTTKGFDTVFYDNLLEVIPLHDTFFHVAYSGHNPKVVKLIPDKNYFAPGDRVRITWGDGSYTDTTFLVGTLLDTFYHTFSKHRYTGLVRLQIWNYAGCNQRFGLNIGWGLETEIRLKGAVCGSKTLCFEPDVLDYTSEQYWKKNDWGGHSVRWDFGDSTPVSDSFSPCHTYDSLGRFTVRLMVADSTGNRDTVSKVVVIQELVADVTSESKDFFCSEIKQLFDSSYLRTFDPDDAITDYLWDFGSGTFTTIEKDPFHTFENGGTYHVTHVVKSRSGCTDTTDFVVKITGSEAAFDILGDTVGCAPFRVTFKNRSKNCKQYIWEYGDPDNNTHNTGSLTNDTFTYFKSGRFYVGLVGIDTFYNPTTGNAYYCNSYFPSSDSPRIITVLPSPKTGLLGPDTLCVGSKAIFTSLSDRLYEMDEWQLDPGPSRFSEVPGMTKEQIYTSPGVYSVWIKPWYTIYPGQPRCFDSAEKKVTVLDVNADFDIDPKSEDPVFTFKNKSNPLDAQFAWNFGQPNSPTNTSTEVHPTHDFYPDRDTFRVCLMAVIPAGCRDTTCKTIRVEYFEDVRLANVFTPDEEDETNRVWDIFIDGERLYDLRIYNRWGELVYRSDHDAVRGYMENWNGRVMNTGPECPEGTYFYQFTYAFSRGNQQAKTVSGSINLIRGKR
ncbi:MAG: PKD domain-containing protein [Bacteroidetes bacterium]|nr:PKD domain-containing protein [Bacteroidota bacterium]